MHKAYRLATWHACAPDSGRRPPLARKLLAVMTAGLALPMWFAAPAMTGMMIVYHYLLARLAITSKLAAATVRGRAA